MGYWRLASNSLHDEGRSEVVDRMQAKSLQNSDDLPAAILIESPCRVCYSWGRRKIRCTSYGSKALITF